MNDTTRRIASVYLVLGIWFLVMLTTAVATLGLSYALDPLGIDVMPPLRGLTAMTLGIVTATIVAGLLWTKLRSQGREEVVASAAPRGAKSRQILPR